MIFSAVFIPMAYADDIMSLQRDIMAGAKELKKIREDIKNSALPQAQKEEFYKSLNKLDKYTLERARGIYNALIASKNVHDPKLFNQLFDQTEAYYNTLIKKRDEFEVAKTIGEKSSTKRIEFNHEELERVEHKLGALKNIKRNRANAIDPLIREAQSYQNNFNLEIKKIRESFNVMSAKLKLVPPPHFPPTENPPAQLSDKMKHNLALAERMKKIRKGAGILSYIPLPSTVMDFIDEIREKTHQDYINEYEASIKNGIAQIALIDKKIVSAKVGMI